MLKISPRQLIAVDLDNVTIRVEKGNVTLSGKVRSPIARDAALAISRNTFGVVDIKDRLSFA